MYNFNYYQPTDIRFGWERVKEIGTIVAQHGNNCLLVTVPPFEALKPVFNNIQESLEEAGVEVKHFDKVVPNPTTNSVNAGVEMGKNNNVDVILGVGGGSSIDTAKAISVGMTHEGEAWDYRLFTDKDITDKVLPIIAVTTTSGTGAHVSPVSVVTNLNKKSKFALVDKLLCPDVSVVDPKLMLTVPEQITASTGFDVFAHAFESFIHKDSSVYIEMHALEAIKRVVKYLPSLLKDLKNEKLRTEMAFADTLAGLCIANAGTTLPHGIGMAIGGHATDVMHGQALSVMYPEFMRYTYKNAERKFAKVGRILNPDLEDEPDSVAAENSCEAMDDFLKEIGMWFTLNELGIPKEELSAIADDTFKLPDYKVNPKVADREELMEMLERRY